MCGEHAACAGLPSTIASNESVTTKTFSISFMYVSQRRASRSPVKSESLISATRWALAHLRSVVEKSTTP